MLSLFHGDYLEVAGDGLLVLFLGGLSPEEDDQVAWKIEYRWGQGELSAHLPCHWCPSWTRSVYGGYGGQGWRWGAGRRGRRGDGPAGSRKSCYTLRHQLQFSLPCEETSFWLWRSLLREDRQGIKRSWKGCVSCLTVHVVLMLSTCPLASVDLSDLLNLSQIVFNPTVQNKEEHQFVQCSTYIYEELLPRTQN